MLGMTLAVLPVCSYAQHPGQIRGLVLDATTKQPLIGANVLVLETSRGAGTDAEGMFLIEGVPEGVHKLGVQYLGYHTHIETDVRVVRGKTTFVEEIGLEEMYYNEQEVTVTADAEAQDLRDIPISSFAYTRETIKRVPGSAGDVFRAMDALPGVSSSGNEYSGMAVRGGAPSDNLILIDNIPFDKVAHFVGGSEGQEAQGGRFSVFAPGVIEDGSFSAGAFSSRYGGKKAALLDLKIREGNQDSYTLNGSYDLLGFEMNYNGPVYALPRTAATVSVRDFNFERPLDLAGQDQVGEPTSTDVVVKTTTRIGTQHKFSVLGVSSGDLFIRRPEHALASEGMAENDVWDIEESRHLLGLNWRMLTSKQSFLQNTLYYRKNKRTTDIGHAFSSLPGGRVPESVADVYVRDHILNTRHLENELGFRSEYTLGFSGGTNLYVGVEGQRVGLDYDTRLNEPDTLYVFHMDDIRPDPSQLFLVATPALFNNALNTTRNKAASYVNLSLKPGKKSTLETGLRVDYSGFNEQTTVSPRARFNYVVAPQTLLSLGTGLYYQLPSYEIWGSHPANQTLRHERAFHLVGGLTQFFAGDYKFTTEVYYKTLDDLLVQPSRTVPIWTNEGDGWSGGIDLLLSKRFVGKYYGHVSYSYSMSERNDRDGLGYYPTDFHQPHILNVIWGLEFNKEWSLSGRWKFATGRPTDGYRVHANIFNDPARFRYAQEILSNNTERLATYHALNLRVDYRKQFDLFALVTFLDLHNAYNKHNPNENQFSETTGAVVPRTFGLVPTFGLKIEI